MRLLCFSVPWRDFKRVTGGLAPACWMDVWVIWVYPLIIDVTPAIIMDLNKKKRAGCNRYKYSTCTWAQNVQKSTVNCKDVWHSNWTWKILFLQTYPNWQAHIKHTLLFLLFTSLSRCAVISDDWSDHLHTHNPLYWSSLLSLFVFFTSAKSLFKLFLTRQDGLIHETGTFCLFSRFDSLHQLDCRLREKHLGLSGCWWSDRRDHMLDCQDGRSLKAELREVEKWSTKMIFDLQTCLLFYLLKHSCWA